MKVIVSDKEDRTGNFPIIFPASARVSEIHEWLFNHFGAEGYKFALIFDESKDEFEVMQKAHVYWLDEIDKELQAYKEGYR